MNWFHRCITLCDYTKGEGVCFWNATGCSHEGIGHTMWNPREERGSTARGLFFGRLLLSTGQVSGLLGRILLDIVLSFVFYERYD